MCWRSRILLGMGMTMLAGCARPVADRFLTPSRGEWQRIGPLRRFTPLNLYDAINGEAPLVISFGLKSLTEATYGKQHEPAFSVALYDMGCEDNAFALFRAHVTLESKPLCIGSEGAGDETRAEFWQGPFCVVVDALPSRKPINALTIAHELARDLPPTRAWPACLQLLPAEHRIPRSEQYAPSDFLGHAFLKKTVSARYKVGDHEVMVFACRYDTPQGAAEALSRLHAALRQGKTDRRIGAGDGGFIGEVPALGLLAVFRRAGFLGGMIPYASSPALDALLKELERCLAS